MDGGLPHHEITGSGPPLLLLHAFGLCGAVWRPVVPLLATDRRVIVVDLPGHGRSPATACDPRGYAREIGLLLDRLDIGRVDVAGNSIGGWTALELARAGRAASVTALSPAGLWPDAESVVRRARFLVEHTAAHAALPVLRRLVRTRRGRKLLFSEAMATPDALPADDAVTLLQAYAGVQDMRAHLAARRRTRFTGGRDLTQPITVAWGARDRLIPPAARNRAELPPQTRWFDLPGCGHVMMWDAPELVAATVRGGTD
jgi:pimeloyl-ACP methyl ester carboxylesterase